MVQTCLVVYLLQLVRKAAVEARFDFIGLQAPASMFLIPVAVSAQIDDFGNDVDVFGVLKPARTRAVLPVPSPVRATRERLLT